ncbi:MAG TPA: DNA polymerase III subunit beta family protein [Candidatus Azoamicus sp.]
MIIKIKVYKLMNMLKIVSKIIKNRKIESILSYILIKIIKNKIFCIAINEEIEIVTYDVYENYIKDMEVVIKCDLIYEICKRCEDNSYIFIKKNRNSIEIKLDDIYFMLPNTFSDKFPCFENEKNNKTKFKIKSQSLHKLFSYLLISLSENNMQEFLNGVYLELNENLITAFTSDGERFTFTYDFIEEHNKNFNIIIPKQTIKEIINLTETTKNIYITLTKKYIKFVTDNTTITSKLINDIYTLPNLKIKQDLITKISLDKNEIKKMLYKINFFIKDKKITFEFEKNTINICTQINNEKAIIYSKINNLFKENLTVSFNNKYFSDILKYISHNTFQFIISKEKKFIIIKEDNCKYMYTLIPF